MTTVTERKTKRADELVVGDRIAAVYLPLADGPAEVLFVRVHEYRSRSRWVFVAYMQGDGYHDSTSYLPEAVIQVVPGDSTGLGYSRPADDPAPASGRVPMQVGTIEGEAL